jgi:hypothetical protein
MELVTGRENRASKPDHEKQRRDSCLKGLSAAKGSPKETGQNRILAQVTEFANQGVNRVDRRPGNIGIQPAQKRNDKARGLLRRQDVSGTQKDYRHPDKSRHPMCNEPKRFHVRKPPHFSPDRHKHKPRHGKRSKAHRCRASAAVERRINKWRFVRLRSKLRRGKQKRSTIYRSEISNRESAIHNQLICLKSDL